MKRALLLFALSAILLQAGLASGTPEESLDLHSRLVSMKEAGKPEVFEDRLILSAKGPWRSVAAAFESEGFATLHPYERNRQGVFLLVLPLPIKARSPIAYRLVVDGAWIVDPLNPLRTETRSGVLVSLAQVPYLSDEVPGRYLILGEDGHTAHFLVKAEPGLVVTLAGSFNNWDPFLYEMEETSPGVYRLDLSLLDGIHYYAFYYHGEAHWDRLNEERATAPSGEVVSVLYVGPRPKLAVKAAPAPAEGGGHGGH
jgi:hypothetical protein